ncbi:MAG: periplasmic heavy metal sensor [Desulfobaccales bacterium]
MDTWSRRLNVALLMVAVALALGLMALEVAYAQPGMGPRGAGLTPEQAQKIYELRQQFLKETEDLRQQMFTKRTELTNLWAAENPDEKQIRVKQQEINALRDKIQAIALKYQTQARKIAPNASFGWGGKKGMRGGPWTMW